MSEYINLFFDIVVVTALSVTIFYCLQLSRYFKEMQAEREAFKLLIQSMDKASERAETAIKALKKNVTQSSDELQEKTGKARGLTEELEIIIQAGDTLASRLEELAKAEKTQKNSPEASRGEKDDKPRTKAEQELLKAVKAKQQS
jgi:chaperonin cofactor prefoldin